MNSLFIEASAKTSINVIEVFTEVVEKILDTPELWAPVSNVTPDRVNMKTGAHQSIPGGVDLNATTEEQFGGCAC